MFDCDDVRQGLEATDRGDGRKAISQFLACDFDC
jgi:hypothetical protein